MTVVLNKLNFFHHRLHLKCNITCWNTQKKYCCPGIFDLFNFVLHTSSEILDDIFITFSSSVAGSHYCIDLPFQHSLQYKKIIMSYNSGQRWSYSGHGGSSTLSGDVENARAGLHSGILLQLTSIIFILYIISKEF